MKNILLTSILGLALIGCNSGFSGVPSTESDVLTGCGGCDISGAGGSLKLMQTTSQITVSTQAATSIPNGSWATGCIANSNNTGSSEIFLTVNITSARLLSRVYRAVGCQAADLDDVQTLFYQFQSLGTATDMIGGVSANKLQSSLLQIMHEPHSQAVATQIQNDCKKKPDGSTQSPGAYDIDPNTGGAYTMIYDGSKAYDTSICYNGGSASLVVGTNDSTTRFYTNGNVLRLGTSSGLASSPSTGYFKK